MNSSYATLGMGFIAALGMIRWGLMGVFTGRVLTKSYGTVEGTRTFYRFVSRVAEPVWFWTLRGVYTSVGVGILLALYFATHRVP